MKLIFNRYSYKKGAALTVACTAVWKLVSFVNGVIIAYKFGASGYTDVYFYLIMLAGAGAVLVSGVNANAVIPQAMAAAREDKKDGAAFLNFFILFYMAAGVLLCAAAAPAPGFWLKALSRFDFSSPADNALFALAAVYFATLTLNNFLINILEYNRFYGAAVLYPLNSLIPLLLLVSFGKSLGISAMLCGFTAACAIQILFCVFVMFFKLGWHFSVSTKYLTKKFWHNAASSFGTEALNLFSSFLPLFIMSGLGGGLVSALSYARQITDSPAEIITQRVNAVSRVQFTEKEQEKDFAGLAESFYGNFFILAAVMTAVAAFTAAFAPEIVRLFFKRGGFTEITAENTALFIRLFAPSLVLALPFYMCGSLAAAARKTKDFFIVPLLTTVFFTAAALFFMNKYGGAGYPAALVLSNIFSVIIICPFAKKYFSYINYGKAIFILLKIILIGAAALLPALALKKVISSYILQIFFCGILYLAAFIPCVFILRKRNLR